MASYQEIDTRLKTVEDKIEFVMQAIKVGQAPTIVGAPPRIMSLLDLYTESRKAGLVIDSTPAEEATNG